jgi:hypothetical protein
MYDMHCTRSNIAFVIYKLSRYTSKLNTDYWKAITRVFGYLKRTIDLGLFYSDFPVVMEGYSDASWMTSSSDNKFILGWIFSFGGGVISWASKKQTCISYSTMESKFIVMLL